MKPEKELAKIAARLKMIDEMFSFEDGNESIQKAIELIRQLRIEVIIEEEMKGKRKKL